MDEGGESREQDSPSEMNDMVDMSEMTPAGDTTQPTFKRSNFGSPLNNVYVEGFPKFFKRCLCP